MENGFDLLTSSLISFLQVLLEISWENLYFDIWLPTSKVYLKGENHHGCGHLTYNKNQRCQLL